MDESVDSFCKQLRGLISRSCAYVFFHYINLFFNKLASFPHTTTNKHKESTMLFMRFGGLNPTASNKFFFFKHSNILQHLFNGIANLLPTPRGLASAVDVLRPADEANGGAVGWWRWGIGRWWWNAGWEGVVVAECVRGGEREEES